MLSSPSRMGTFMLYAFKLALFKQIWVVPPLNPSKIFSDPPLLGSQLRLIPPSVLLKIKWSPPKSSDPPQVINNDRSLNNWLQVIRLTFLRHRIEQKRALNLSPSFKPVLLFPSSLTPNSKSPKNNNNKNRTTEILGRRVNILVNFRSRCR